KNEGRCWLGLRPRRPDDPEPTGNGSDSVTRGIATFGVNASRARTEDYAGKRVSNALPDERATERVTDREPGEDDPGLLEAPAPRSGPVRGSGATPLCPFAWGPPGMTL